MFSKVPCDPSRRTEARVEADASIFGAVRARRVRHRNETQSAFQQLDGEDK